MELSAKLDNKNIIANSLDEMLSKLDAYIIDEECTKAVDVIKDEVQKLDPEYPIILEENDKQFVAAHLEFGRHHGKNYHKVSYKRNYKCWQHAVIHELMHLDMYLRAEKQGHLYAFRRSADNDSYYNKSFGIGFRKFEGRFGKEGASEFAHMIQEGMITLLISAPLDLFVEQRIFDRYKELRPLQLQSLLAQQKQNIIQHHDKTVLQLPPKLLSSNKILCLVYEMQVRELYDIELLQEFDANKHEVEIATDFYEEYKAIIESYADGDEYELYDYFTESLDFVELIDKE